MVDSSSAAAGESTERASESTTPEPLVSSETAEARTELSTLSPSRASDYKTCPQLFKFRSIDKIPEPVTIHQARGTTAHLALERMFDLEPGARTHQHLADLFREAWTELRQNDYYSGLFSTVEEERAWGLESLGLLANYFQFEDPTTVTPLARELDLLEELDGITIRGILDRMDRQPDGTLSITDYKTGKAPPEQYATKAFFALKIYALLIRRRLAETPTELRLLYLNGPTLYTMSVDDAALDAMHKQLQALWAAINKSIASSNFPPRPGPLCAWCSYRDICPAFNEIGESPQSLAPR